MTDDDIKICPGHITVRDYPSRDHPEAITVQVQCTRKPTHRDNDPDDKHFGWIMSGVHVEWNDSFDGGAFDSDSPFITHEVF